MVNFRKFDFEKDVLCLYEFLSREDLFFLFPGSLNGGINNPTEFINRLKFQLSGYYHEFYLITRESQERDQICGFFLAYDYRTYDSHCQAVCHVTDKDTKVMSDIVYDLFREYPLNKIFLNIYDFDTAAILAAEKIGFRLEATLSQYKFLNGSYHDKYIYGIKSKLWRCENE